MANETEVAVAPSQGESTSENAVQAANQDQNGQVNPVQPAQPAAQGSYWSIVKTLLIRMFFIYMISSWFRSGKTPPAQGAGGSAPLTSSMNLYPKDTVMDMYIYLSEDKTFTNFEDESTLFWMVDEMVYGDWTGGEDADGTFTKSSQVHLSENVQNNGSLYMHVYLVRSGKSPNPRDTDMYEEIFTVHKTKQMNKLKKRKYHTLKNLLTGTTEVHPDLVRGTNETTFEILSHWHPNLTINLIDDHTPWVRGSVPAPLDEFIEFQDGSNFYYPVLYFNDYWNLNHEYQPINETTPVVNLTLSFSPLTLFRWQMYAAQSMRSRWYSFMGDIEENDEDQDSLKTAMVETNPYLLGLTIVVSIVHSVFEFLAFKNDIQFWRNRKTLEGLSVRSVFFNVFQSLVVLLYVLDNETNFVVRVSVFIGLGIEVWKIFKVVDFRVDRENKLFGVVPKVWFVEKSTYTESLTKRFDQLAFKYLSWLLFPLLGCYAVYSVLYQEHRSWYSWVLGMLYGFLLTFGFIMMTPQLFINYKMKSVAHLPWRMLTYKALNTFIDDLFAFVIKMPTLYRIGCFRDDIVFCIYLYQKYIYPVDKKRMNEFGTTGETPEEAAQNGEPQPIEGATEADTEEDAPAPAPAKSEEEKKED